MNRVFSSSPRALFLAAAILPQFLPSLTAQPTPDQRPNVLLIAVDDLNDWPRMMGVRSDARTPHMDRLASRGTLFSRAYAQAALCGPSRASVMTGLLPSTLEMHGHVSDQAVIKRAREFGVPALHTYFRKHGYETLAVGKIFHQHVPKGSVDQSGGRGSFGPVKRFVWHQLGTSTDWGAWPEADAETEDAKSAAWAIERLNEPREQPFFLMVGFLRPHVPWYVPQKWFDLYPDPDRLKLPPYDPDDWEDIPFAARRTSVFHPAPTTEWASEFNHWRDIIHAYLASVSFVDDQIGKVLQALAASPYADNTLVVLWSDHGYHLGEKGLFQKMTLWERSAHVPLVVAGPGIEPGISRRVVSLVDIYPTLLELARLPPVERLEGRSLVPLIREPGRPWDFPAYTFESAGDAAIQTERYRLIRYADGSLELYDHHTDPHERNNLAAPSIQPARLPPSAQPLKEALEKEIPRGSKKIRRKRK